MNYYIKSIFSLFILMPFISNSQVIDTKLIINAPKVNLRQYPTDTSKVIYQLIGGEEVTMFDTIGVQEKFLHQEINKYPGHWIEVKYKDKIGYVYNRYIIRDFSIFEEGQHLDRIPMAKYLYGIYKTDFGDYIRPVNLVIKDEGRINHDDDTIKVRAIRVNNRKDTSIMLIFTNKLMKEGIIGDFTKFVQSKTHDEHTEFRHLKAGDIEDLFCKFEWLGNRIYGKGIVYQLQAEGSFQMQSDNFVRGNSYKLFVTYYNSDNRKSIKQEITQFIPNTETFYSVEIVYFGDLDNDNKPDVILQTCQEGGCSDYILLSTTTREGELLRLSSIRFHADDC